MTNAPSQEAEGVAVTMYVPGGHVEITAPPRQDPPAQLRRRRQASMRLEPMPDGRRDPWSRRGLRDENTSFSALDSWVRALQHLRGVGLVGLPPADVQEALAGRGWAA